MEERERAPVSREDSGMPGHRWDPVCPIPHDLTRPVRIDPTGRTGPTKRQASGPRWIRTSHGFYLPADTPRDLPEQRILEQSVRLPSGGAVTGWAACRLHRAALIDGLGRDGRTPLPVPLALGPTGNIRADDQVLLTYERLDATEVVLRLGMPCVDPLRATFDAMRQAGDDREAVVVMDMMAAAECTSLVRMRGHADAHPGWQDIDRVRRALALASELSRSPNETRLRLIWVLDAGLPPGVLVNCPVLDRAGRLLGIADLLDERAGLAVEFDGAEHRRAGRQTRDVRKDEEFRSHGLEVTRVTGLDLLDVPRVVHRLLDARGRARFDAGPDRRWVARPAVDSLEARLQEREAMARVREELAAQPRWTPPHGAS